MSTIPDSVHQDTLAARYAVNTDDNHGAVIPPLYMSSNFSFHGFGEKREYDYSRSGNPNRDQLAGALAALEGGAGGVITASGMSAVHLATQLVKPGELIVAPHDCYGGCHRLFTAASNRGLFELEWLPLWETEVSVRQILELQPRIVWIETPSNPFIANHRYRSDCAGGTRSGRTGRGRQHLPVTGGATALQPGCGYRAALHHQVHQRSLGHSRRRGAGQRRSAGGGTGLVGQLPGPDRFAFRQLPDPAWSSHPQCPLPAARRKCRLL